MNIHKWQKFAIIANRFITFGNYCKFLFHPLVKNTKQLWQKKKKKKPKHY